VIIEVFVVCTVAALTYGGLSQWQHHFSNHCSASEGKMPST
jgi:hypothetical protein